MQLLDQPAAICLCPSLWGFDYNKAPLAPPGIHVLAHDKPNECGMLAPHGAEGWYIDAASRILGLTALNSLLQCVKYSVWEVCSVN